MQYNLHKSQTNVSAVSQVNSISILPAYFFYMYFNIILPPKPRFSNWSLSYRLSCAHCVH